jgi:NADH-quinone oxidoreductase subunit J
METSLIVRILFYFFSAITVASACIVVFSRNLIYSAFGLLITFFGVAALYVLLGADFLAAAQMVIYVGGILVLLIFGIMLTHKLYDLKLKSETFQFWPALILMLGVFLAIATVLLKTRWFYGDAKPVAPTTAEIGQLFMGEFILPFEIASVFLLVALIGAAMIIRRKPE